jgi:hypothetical protein
MSDEEKFEAQGRAYAELKQARGNVATLTESLLRSARDLKEIAAGIHRLLEHPEDQETALTTQERLKKVNVERLTALIGELDSESQKAAMLQRRTDQF